MVGALALATASLVACSGQSGLALSYAPAELGASESQSMAADVASLLATRLSRGTDVICVLPAVDGAGFRTALEGALRQRGFAVAGEPNGDAVPIRFVVRGVAESVSVTVSWPGVIAARSYGRAGYGAETSGGWSVGEAG